MTRLEQKLEQLKLPAMSQQLEKILTEAASKNLTVAATLEWLIDMELEARRNRAVDRRFKYSRLQVQLSIDTFHFQHHKSRLQNKTRILRLLDLSFLATGANLVLIGNPGVGKTFLAKIVGWRACQANQRVLFTTAMDMLNQLSAAQVDHSLVRKLKGYTEPSLVIIDELGYLALDQASSNLFYRSSLLATARNALRLSPRTHRFPTGATSCSTPPSPRQSPIAWWKTLRSSCSAATVCASPAKTRIRRLSNSRRLSGMRRAVVISRAGGVRRVTPQRR
jgi:DNA replication protein DnaC